MNFLAHVYLSGNNKPLMFGNFIGDFVKGNAHLELPLPIQKGVVLHREIDRYTDLHPANMELKRLLYPEFGKYAGVFLDVFQDHLLAHNWKDFSGESLRVFCTKFYFNLVLNHKYMPSGVRIFTPTILKTNGLQNYESIDFLKEVFEQMSERTSLPPKGDLAVDFFKENYETFKESFYRFFPDIIRYTRKWREDASNGKKGQGISFPKDFKFEGLGKTEKLY